jgi:phosphate uptake regulator
LGDYAVYTAKRAKDTEEARRLLTNDDLLRMMEIGSTTLRDSVRALTTGDEALARSTALRDEEMNDLKRKIYHDLLAIMTKDPEVKKMRQSFYSLAVF